MAGDMRGLGAMVVKASSTESRMPQNTKAEHLHLQVPKLFLLQGSMATHRNKNQEGDRKWKQINL